MTKHLYAYKDISPNLADDVFVAPTAAVVGDVRIGQGSSIWYGCTLRGDVEKIRIGSMTNIQDGTVGHVTTDKYPLMVGDRVTVGHNATIHACTIHDEVLIGMGSVVMDGAVVEKHAMVAAGAVVSPSKVVKSGELWAGVPAKKVRDVTAEEIQYILWSAKHYYELGQRHKQATTQK